jgi:hypothetical protein
MKKSQIIASILLATACSPLMAQMKVGEQPQQIDPSAMLEVKSTNKGLLYPRVALTATTAAAPLAAHVTGMQVYNTAEVGDVTPGNYFNDGTQWIRLISETPDLTQLANEGAPTGTCQAKTSYTDISETSPTAGQQWTCVGGIWKSYSAPSSTPFYINGTTKDVGASKTAAIERSGHIFLKAVDKKRYTQITNDGGIRFNRSSTAPYSQYAGYIDFSDVTTNLYKFRIAMRTDPVYGTGGALAFQTNDQARMAFTADGRLGIGTNKPQELLHVAGSITGMFDDATGDLAQGTSSKFGYTLKWDGSNTYGAIQNGNANPNLFLSKSVEAEANPFARFVEFKLNGVTLGQILRSGTGISYGVTSDKRLKENIKSTHYSIQDVMNINVTDYNYISDKSKKQVTGFIAQELYKVFPDAVNVGGDDVKENPWTVDYGKVTPLLVKAIQDQQKEIAALKAQLSGVSELKAELDGVKAMLTKVIGSDKIQTLNSK